MKWKGLSPPGLLAPLFFVVADGKGSRVNSNKERIGSVRIKKTDR